MRAMRCAVLAAMAVVTACAGKKEEVGDTLARDTALAADLREIAGDTSAFSEAADVAMRDIPDSTLPMPAPSKMTTTPGKRAIGGAEDAPAPRPVPIPVTPVPVRPAPPVAARPSSTPVQRAQPAAPAAIAQGTGDPTPACSSPALADQRRCLMAYLARSDVTLDRNYQARIAQLKREAGTAPGDPEPESVRQLRVAQRAWLVYRDTECRKRNRGREGPLWAPVRARCLADFSDARADELR